MITANSRNVKFILVVRGADNNPSFYVERVKRNGMIAATQRLEAAKQYPNSESALEDLYRIKSDYDVMVVIDVAEILVNTTVYFKNEN